jgi:septal ring factor EnvC (AmiA/AmiB activator)
MQLFTQKLSQKTRTQWCIIVLSTLLLFIPASTVFANDAEPNELKEQQQKLKKILDEIGDVREQRSEQKATLERLSKKMQCNWDLIQDYDACGKKYNEQKQEQLNCAQKAKERARDCLSELGE